MVRQKPAKLPFPSSNLGATFSFTKEPFKVFGGLVLILIATPLGNLSDISKRAIQELSTADYLLCEDTRHTGNLLSLLGLTPPKMQSLHRFNEKFREEEILVLLKEGKKVALVSDAGMPGISDPGAHLVDCCHKERITVSVIPGPSAFVSAFAVSGAVDVPLQFVGFLPKADGELSSMIQQIALYRGASAAYESPNRLLHVLKTICDFDAKWEILVVRELTKIYEEIIRRPVAQLVAHFEGQPVRGECVIVFMPRPQGCQKSDEELVREIHELRQRFSCSLKEAVELVASTYSLSKRELYQLCIS